MKISARVLVLLCFVVFSLFFATKAQAADYSAKSYNEDVTSNALNLEEDVPANLHTGAQLIMIETLSAVVCQLAGFDPISKDHKCLGVNPETGKIGFVENGGGMLAVAGSMIDATFTPPATTGQYLSYMGSNFGITKGAYAQFGEGDKNPCEQAGEEGINARGIGFCGIEPVLKIWVAMRNIVYLILILVFVVIGLGIMLRVHIDPRTVMTVQNQIPKIIVGIVAITFSFAIAGLLIDVMWVTVYLFASVLTSATGSSTANMFNIVQSANPFDAANNSFNFQGSTAGFNSGILGVANETSRAFAGLIQGAFESRDDWGLAGDLIGGLVNVLAFVVITIAIISALLRLWVVLVFAYINIILDVIFAPFWILSGLLPGSSLGLSAWIRDLMANLAVFPVTIAFFIIANYLIGAVETANADSLTTRFVPPLLGGQNGTAVAALIGFGFVLMLPQVLNTVKSAFKAPKLDFGPIFKPVAAGTNFVGGVPKRFVDVGERYRYSGGKKLAKFDRLFKLVGNPIYNQGKSGHS